MHFFQITDVYLCDFLDKTVDYKKNNMMITLLIRIAMLSHFSCIRCFVIPCTVAHQVLLSVGFFRQEYWSGLPFLPPGDLPNQ